MVCRIYPAVSGDASGSPGVYQTAEGRGAYIYHMDRLLLRGDIDDCSHEDGGKGHHIMSDCADTSFFVLCGRISDAFVVLVFLSQNPVESFQNSMLCLIYIDGYTFGMLCKSDYYENVSPYTLAFTFFSHFDHRLPIFYSYNFSQEGMTWVSKMFLKEWKRNIG